MQSSQSPPLVTPDRPIAFRTMIDQQSHASTSPKSKPELPSGFLFNFGFVFHIKVSVLPSVRLTLPRNAWVKLNTVFLLFFLLFCGKGPHFVAQAGLELMAILLPQTPKCWGSNCESSQLTYSSFSHVFSGPKESKISL